MQADTITEPPRPEGELNGHAYTNGHGKKAYDCRSFLSDRAKVSEIDGIRGLMSVEGPGVVSFVSYIYVLGVQSSLADVFIAIVAVRACSSDIFSSQFSYHKANSDFSRAGRPNPTSFPFSAMTLTIKPPLADPSALPVDITIDGNDLDTALQYGPSAGLPKLRDWLEQLQSKVHKRERGNWTISLGSGSQDMMYKGFMSILNPGDPILLETPLYPGALPALRHLNAELIEVDVDDQGLSPDNLERILSTWPEGKKRPRVIYTSPVGTNPSGCSATKERKLAVLEVCKKYDVLIFEDDPYYYLAQELIPSYFELETQVYPEGGHVLRFDSFSKLLSAGMRLGFATGPKELLHAIDVCTAGANLHTSSVSQAVVLGLVQHWGIEGFLSHGRGVAKLYAERRAEFEAIAHKHLNGLATWVPPVAGMFLWVDMSPAGIRDSYDLIRHEALAKGVLGVPGMTFYPKGRKSPHVRLSFSIVDLIEETELGFARLAEAIREKRKTLGLE
ncbi:hypothetical protein CI109_105664 [Kwoniella shandongensis]|uniref:Aminotransferase class I/classII large domain-containing protein n=1 Tax=Kwoniella shandongensis TaxID=1734106 RepID=A0AAJ8LQ18_9TREE